MPLGECKVGVNSWEKRRSIKRLYCWSILFPLELVVDFANHCGIVKSVTDSSDVF